MKVTLSTSSNTKNFEQRKKVCSKTKSVNSKWKAKGNSMQTLKKKRKILETVRDKVMLRRKRTSVELEEQTYGLLMDNDALIAGRPKRVKSSKDMNNITGLSWHEESELQKALYASIAQNKKRSGQRSSREELSRLMLLSRNRDNDKVIPNAITASPNPDTNLENKDRSISKTSQCSSPSNRSKIMVQRKFAEGFRPQSPLSSYCKVVGNSTPRQVQVLPQKAKTEDFLSFLCLRGSPKLPAHLDFFNCANVALECSSMLSSSHESGNYNTPVGSTLNEKVVLSSPSSEKNMAVEKPNEQRLQSDISNPCDDLIETDSANEKQVFRTDSKFAMSAKRRIEWPSEAENVKLCQNTSNRLSPRRFYCTSRVILTKLDDMQASKYAKNGCSLRSGKTLTETEKKITSVKDKCSFSSMQKSCLPNSDLPERKCSPHLGISKLSRKSMKLYEKAFAQSCDKSSKNSRSESSYSFDSSEITIAPTYYPSVEQFEDPIAYITSIWSDAQPYGICRIVPPTGWKPECSLPDDLRFMTNVQYIHKMFHRFGPSALKLECIRKHLSMQDITIQHPPPQVGGVELDLPALLAAVQECGGLQTVINKNKWSKVADLLRIPKWAQDRGQKLWDTYVKYLLSYETLSKDEKETLEKQVIAEWNRKKKVKDDCMIKNKSRLLTEFFGVGRNIMAMWFGEDEPSNEKIEQFFWKTVMAGEPQLSVLAAAVDSISCGSAFSTNKHSPYATHGWNFNVIQNASTNILKPLGPISEVTASVLLMSMLFTATCIHRDLHLLPQIHYLHTGADMIWYCMPGSEENKLKQTLSSVAPNLVKTHQEMWLPHDVVMVPPNILTMHGVSLSRLQQKQGEFIVILPESFIFNISCGYSIGEIIHFATPHWLSIGQQASKTLHVSGEPELFSFDKLVVLLCQFGQLTEELCSTIHPILKQIMLEETTLRKSLLDCGLQQIFENEKKHSISPTEYRCDTCHKICCFSMVEINKSEHNVKNYCLNDGVQVSRKCKNFKDWRLKIFIPERDLENALLKVQDFTSVIASRTRHQYKSSLTSTN